MFYSSLLSSPSKECGRSDRRVILVAHGQNQPEIHTKKYQFRALLELDIPLTFQTKAKVPRADFSRRSFASPTIRE
ncbi:hypothetical protein [Variovorax sp. UMC13]|uniref:hypothetical protein n=1 Tax=Variovorax sp. UMC13 TaxID=1862326 RepID=UPI001601C14D|nr:hypothetical protein [Variovorax sp. UMC13]